MPTGSRAQGRKRRILAATSGTLGDLLPFVELGRRLTQRGHEFTLACPTGLHSWVERAGLRAAEFDGDFGKEKAQSLAKSWDHWAGTHENQATGDRAWPDSRYSALIEKLESNSRRLSELVSGVDMLLTPTNCPEGRLVHDLTGIPWAAVILIPEDALRPRDIVDERFAKAMNELLQRLGLRERFTSYLKYKRSDYALFACSKALARSADSSVVQTGFWFYEDPAWENWCPDEQLRRFMEGGEPPLVLSFSSLPLENPADVLNLHVRAAQLLGRKLIVQQGWSGFSKEHLPPDIDPKTIYMSDFFPHDWLFARAAGLITHGGIGTLGRALRQGCPMVIEPYGNDQFFNSLLITRLGYGSAVRPHSATAEGLARVIRSRLLHGSTREALAGAKKVIEGEDGLGSACDFIERRTA